MTDWRPLLDDALAGSDDAPLSVRKAMLVVMLADAVVDDLARAAGATDPLAARAELGATSADLELVLELAEHRAAGPRLVVESVHVQLEDYGTLSTAEFMVSLYNENTVPRLLVALPDGSRQDARAVLHGAVEAL